MDKADQLELEMKGNSEILDRPVEPPNDPL